jgi:hypothetical protein
MNYRRILVGGLLAGVIVNASEFLLNGVVMAKQMQADMAKHALVMAGWAMAGFVIMAFIFGLALAWLYAAFRPRFGQGFRTALVAAATVWTLSYLLPTTQMMAMGMGDSPGYLLALVWGAVELVIAGAVAGYLYREVEAAPAATAVPVG